MGALRLRKRLWLLKPNYTVIMGITEHKAQINSIINKFNSLDKLKNSLENTKDFGYLKAS